MAEYDDALELLGITEQDIFELEAEKIDAGVDKEGERVMRVWHGMSPEDSGDYKDGFTNRHLTAPDGRPVSRVSNSSKHAHIVEYGSEDQRAHSTRAKVAQKFDNVGRYTVEGAE